MTKKELRTMYDKMSLSEERMTELEKRLDDCFEHEPENISDSTKPSLCSSARSTSLHRSAETR